MKPILIYFLMVFLPNTHAKAQSLAGTTWNMKIPTISAKPYNLIFGVTGNKGSLLMPDKTLADFTWTEDGKGNWSISVERMINGIKKVEIFYGKITGNKAYGFYYKENYKKLKPLSMLKI